MATKKRVLQYAISFILVVCVTIGVIMLLGPTSVYAAPFKEEPQLEPYYVVGDRLEMPQCSLIIDGKEYPADTALRYPDGTTVRTNAVLFEEAGKYVLTYSCTVDGKIYSRNIDIIVKKELFQIDGTKGSAAFDEIDGTVSLSLVSGESFCYNVPIDLSGKTQNDEIISLYLSTSQNGLRDIETYYIVFTDMYDQSKKEYIKVTATDQKLFSAYHNYVDGFKAWEYTIYSADVGIGLSPDETVRVHQSFSEESKRSNEEDYLSFRYFVLTKDLDFSGKAPTITVQGQNDKSSIGVLTGTIDGQGYTLSFTTDSNTRYFIDILVGATIKNIAFNYVSNFASTGSENPAALIWRSRCADIENVYVHCKIQNVGNNGVTGLIYRLQGYVDNVVVVVEDIREEKTDLSGINGNGAISGRVEQGTINNSYVIDLSTMGRAVAAAGDTAEHKNDSVGYYKTLASFFKANPSFAAETGWNTELWAVTADGDITFGGKVVIEKPDVIELDSYTTDAVAPTVTNGTVNWGDIEVDLSEVTGVISQISINGEDLTSAYNAETGKVTFSANKIVAGANIEIKASDYSYLKPVIMGTIELGDNVTSINDFVIIINAKLDGNFVMTKDLDFSGTAPTTTPIATTGQNSGYGGTASIGAMTGSLDGQGHTLSFTTDSNTRNFIDRIDNGTIKNIGFDYVSNFGTDFVKVALIGALEYSDANNIFVRCRIQTGKSSMSVSGLCYRPFHTKVNNVVVLVEDIRADKTETLVGERAGAINGRAEPYSAMNSYAIDMAAIGRAVGQNSPTGDAKDDSVGYFTTIAAMLASNPTFDAAAGWNTALWAITDDGSLSFGGKVVLQKINIVDVKVDSVTPTVTGGAVNDIEITLTGYEGEVTKITYDGVDVTASYADGKVLLPFASLSSTGKTLLIETTKGEYTQNLIIGTIELGDNVTSINDFVIIINAKLDGNFVMTKDLDFSGTAPTTTPIATTGQNSGYGGTASIGAMTGSLDGQGHILSFTTDSNTRSFIDRIENGTIKNIGFDYVSNFGADFVKVALIGALEYSEADNIFVRCRIQTGKASMSVSGLCYRPFWSTVNNVVVLVEDIRADQTATLAGDRGGAINGIAEPHSAMNSYAIDMTTIGRAVGQKNSSTGDVKDESVGYYTTIAAMLASNPTFDATAGWNTELWAVTADGITFGGEVVIAATAE